MKYLSLILILVFFVYISILCFTYIFQRNLLYHPNENNYSTDKLKVSIEKIQIKTTDKLELLAWYHKKKKNNNRTIIFLHGNAGSLENRIHKINHFKNLEVNFLILAWRGFSGNGGKPSEKGLYEDANSAIRWLKSQGIKEKNMIIYGESLGTGVAIEIAQNRNFGGIILESPFTSMVELGQKKYFFLPINILLKDKYESYKKIKNINIPVLVMHGQLDNLVPFYMGKKIYSLFNQPKYSYFPKYDNHMMNYDIKLLSNINIFLKSLN